MARTGVVGSYTVGKGSFAFVWWGWALSYDFASIPRAPIVKKEEPFDLDLMAGKAHQCVR